MVPDPKVLCLRLTRDLMEWELYVQIARAQGWLTDAQRWGEPPPDPGLEPRLADDPTGVAARCQSMEEARAKRAGWTIIHPVVTQNVRFGAVWRSDAAAADASRPDRRALCWRSPADGAYMTAERPLEVLDPKQSIAPLQ